MTIDESLRRAIVEAVTASLEEPLAEFRAAVEALSRFAGHAAAAHADPEMLRVSQLEYLTAPEAGKLLRIGRQQIYKLVNAGHLRCTRVGNRQIFRRTDLDEFMGRHQHHVPIELPAAARARLELRDRAGDS